MNAKELFLKDFHFTKKKAILSLGDPHPRWLMPLHLPSLARDQRLVHHLLGLHGLHADLWPIHIGFAIRYLVREKKQEPYAKAKQEASFMEQKDAQDEKGE